MGNIVLYITSINCHKYSFVYFISYIVGNYTFNICNQILYIILLIIFVMKYYAIILWQYLITIFGYKYIPYWFHILYYICHIYCIQYICIYICGTSIIMKLLSIDMKLLNSFFILAYCFQTFSTFPKIFVIFHISLHIFPNLYPVTNSLYCVFIFFNSLLKSPLKILFPILRWRHNVPGSVFWGLMCFKV